LRVIDAEDEDLSSLTLVLSDVTIAFALTVLLIAWAPSFPHLARWASCFCSSCWRHSWRW
jgi:hypothetical protein